MNAQLRDRLLAESNRMKAKSGMASYALPDSTRELLREAAAALAAPKEAGPDFDALAYRFLAWPLAGSVCADPCASMQNYPNRTGTNLLSFVEAKAMLQHVLTTPCPIDGLTEPHVGMDPPHQYTANPPGDQRQEGEWPCMTFDGHRVQCEPAIRQQVECALLEWGMRERAKHEAASPPPEAAAAVGEDGIAISYVGGGALVKAPNDRELFLLDSTIQRLAALSAPTGPQPAGGGVDGVMVEAARLMDEAMDMQEKRETGEFHLSAPAARHLWDRARAAYIAAIKGDSHAG